MHWDLIRRVDVRQTYHRLSRVTSGRNRLKVVEVDVGDLNPWIPDSFRLRIVNWSVCLLQNMRVFLLFKSVEVHKTVLVRAVAGGSIQGINAII